jgi:hypothetical protein
VRHSDAHSNRSLQILQLPWMEVILVLAGTRNISRALVFFSIPFNPSHLLRLPSRVNFRSADGCLCAQLRERGGRRAQRRRPDSADATAARHQAEVPLPPPQLLLARDGGQ